jgi:hypothetical protein
VPPDDDAPPDEREMAVVRAMVQIIVRELREEALARASRASRRSKC